MHVFGVIAEYDPFHNGHAYHLSQIRKDGATHIVVALGADFTQRGEPAYINRLARAKAALQNGADLVIAMPITGTLAGAQRFAENGVALLHALGCVETLSFGSECGDINALKNIAELLQNELLNQKISQNLSSPQTFAALRENAVRELFGNDAADLLKNPNNSLGIAYIQAIRSLNAEISLHTVKRNGAKHGESPVDSFASAGYLRSFKTTRDMQAYIPENVAQLLQNEFASNRAPVLMDSMEIAILSRLRALREDDFCNLPDCSEGLEHRLFAAVRKAGSMKELEEALKTKRYPLARLRRFYLSAALGITNEDSVLLPQYLRVLGANQRGFEILRHCKDTASLPIIQKAADANSLTGAAKHQWELDNAAADFYALGMPVPVACGYEYTQKFFSLK